MESLAPLKDKFFLGEPSIISNLILFPIISLDTSSDFHFKTLDEGMREIRISVTEPGRGYSSVNIVNNYVDSEVFIIDGEGIYGGKQNRIAASSLVIEPNKSRRISVYCSEEGRSSGSDRFSSSDTIAYPSIRRINTRNKTLYGGYTSQSKIWSEISRKQKSLKVTSYTKSMQDIYKEKEEELGRFKEYKAKENQVGFLAATQNRFLCIDILYNNPILGKLQMKLLMSYALDVIEDEEKGTGSFQVEKWRDFFNGIFLSVLIKKKSSTNEYHYQFKTKSNSGIGKVLLYKNQLIHSSFFNG